jgi:cellulose synthase/poly-beta-1,6-N-acetylglucosamine synthase-like glycosyltransferase
VIDKENGGKADALNAGLNYCYTPTFCAMDADSLLEPEALIRIVRPFLEDATTIAVGGILRIANGCRIENGRVVEVRLPKNLLARFQVLEYLRVFLAGRMGWASLDASLIISGAFGIFSREAVVSAGGYATDTVGEDMELVVRLHRYHREKGIPYKIHFVPDPVAWTECPESISVLARQRDRWQRGLYQTLTRHFRLLLNPRYGKAGLLAFPYFFFLEMLGPVIELLGYLSFIFTIASGRADWWLISAFLATAIVLGGVLSLAAVALEELSFRRYPRRSDLLRLFGLAALESFGYRQLNTWWRVKGTYSALRGVEGWGRMTRRGFQA